MSNDLTIGEAAKRLHLDGKGKPCAFAARPGAEIAGAEVLPDEHPALPRRLPPTAVGG